MTETWRNGIASVNNQRKWLSKHKGLEFGVIHWHIEKQKWTNATPGSISFSCIYLQFNFSHWFSQSLSGSMTNTLYKVILDDSIWNYVSSLYFFLLIKLISG